MFWFHKCPSSLLNFVLNSFCCWVLFSDLCWSYQSPSISFQSHLDLLQQIHLDLLQIGFNFVSDFYRFLQICFILVSISFQICFLFILFTDLFQIFTDLFLLHFYRFVSSSFYSESFGVVKMEFNDAVSKRNCLIEICCNKEDEDKWKRWIKFLICSNQEDEQCFQFFNKKYLKMLNQQAILPHKHI